MKPFKYKDIGQHGPSYKKTKVSDAAESESPKLRPAGKVHKKKGLRSLTLVRPL
ncbi:MAG TPA: hypothetical protein VG964_02190 [Candidatus Saccharimonadales bacterium]|nr:hypothetical protein [Candidatus Saccharimonadales bacterium]